MNRYTIKVETNVTTQSYTLRESDTIQSVEDVKARINDLFLAKIDQIFLHMSDGLNQLLIPTSDRANDLVTGII